MEAIFVLGLLVVAMWLFAREILPVEITTLLMLVALVVLKILSPAEAFSGFSNDIVIILGSIFVICGALQDAGVLEAVGSWLSGVSTMGFRTLLASLMGATGAISAFMNNTTVTAVMVPPVMGLAKRVGTSPSKLLLPVAYASILGGTCTLIGTSTNVAVSGYMKAIGLHEIGLFEITPIGLIILACGIVYLLLVAPHLLPDTGPAEDGGLGEDLRQYLSEIVVLPGSPLVGKPIQESELAKFDLRVLHVVRGTNTLSPDLARVISAGDVLVVNAPVQTIMQVKATAGIEIRAETKPSMSQTLGEGGVSIAKFLVTPQSEVRGKTIGELHFFQRYGLTVLAVYHHGLTLRSKLSHARLRMGDVLLVQGPEDRLLYARSGDQFAVLEEKRIHPLQPRKAMVVGGLFVAAVLAAAFGVAPVSVCFLSAAILCVMCRCMPVARAYDFIEWRLLILIAGMTAFGAAMDKSGASSLLAGHLVSLLESMGAHVMLGGFCLLTVLLTQPMSNAAAALVVLPVAVESAKLMGADPRSFGIAIMLSASVSFITPLEPSCILVYGPGRYRFMDFVKVGAGLTIVSCAIVILLVPFFWPL